MKGKTLWIAVAFAVLAAGPAETAAQGPKIGVIDVNRILNESEAGKAARKTMEGRYEDLKKRLEAKQEEAKKLKDELDREKILVDKKEKLKPKEDALAAKINELRQMTQESEKEMQGRQRELEREILASIESQVAKVVEAEKIDLLLDKMQSGVIHFRPDFEITAKVLELVNRTASVPPAGTGKETTVGK